MRPTSMAPPQRQQMSAADLELLSEILRRAEAVSEQQRPSLLNILRQYEDVLREHGIGSTNDTYFYKIILQLSRMPGNDWWAKLAAESQKGWAAPSKSDVVPPGVAAPPLPASKPTLLLSPRTRPLESELANLPIGRWLGRYQQPHAATADDGPSSGEREEQTPIRVPCEPRPTEPSFSLLDLASMGNEDIEEAVPNVSAGAVDEPSRNDEDAVVVAFRAWSMAATENKNARRRRVHAIEQCTKALTFWQNTLSRKTFLSLHDRVRQTERRYEMIRNMVVHNRTRTLFVRWRKKAQVQSRRFDVLTIAISFWSGRIMQRCFINWSNHTARINRFQASRLGRFCRSLLLQWRDLAVSNIQYVSRSRRIERRWALRVRQRVFSRWRRSAALEQVSTEFANSRARDLRAESFRNWLVCSRQNSLADLYCFRLYVKPRFRLWHNRLLALDRCAMALYDRRCRQGVLLLRHWNAVARSSRSVRLITGFFVRRRARCWLRSLQIDSRRARHLQEAHDGIVALHNANTLRRHAIAWRQQVQRRIELSTLRSAVHELHERHSMAAALRAWSSLTRSESRSKVHSLTAATFHVHWRLRDALLRLVQHTTARQRWRLLETRAIAFWVRWRGLPSIQQWRQFSHRRRRRRRLQQLAHVHRARAARRSAWQTWSASYRLHSTLALQREAQLHAWQRSRHLRVWLAVQRVRARARRALRFHLQQQTQYLVREVFGGWLEFACRRGRVERTAREVDRMRARRAWQLWRRRFRLQRGLTSIELANTMYAMRVALMRWQTLCFEEMRRVRVAIAYDHCNERRRASRLLMVWRHLAGKLMQLRQRLQEWRQHSLDFLHRRRHAFRRWRRLYAYNRSIYSVERIYRRVFFQRHAAWALQQWNDALPFVAPQVNVLRRLRTSVAHRRLRPALQQWRRLAQIQVIARYITRRLLFRCWRRAFLFNARARLFYFGARRRHAIHVWHAFATGRSSSRRLVTQAAAFHRVSAWRSVINCFRHNAAHCVRMRHLHQCGKRHLVRRFLHRWRLSYNREVHLAASFDYVRRLQRRRLLRVRLDVWRAVLTAHLHLSDCESRATHYHRQRRLLTACRRLRANAIAAIDRRRVLTAFCRLHDNVLQRSVLIGRWRSYTDHRRREREHFDVISERQRVQRLAAAYAGWRRLRVVLVERRGRVRAAAAHYRRRVCGRSLCAWSRVCPSVSALRSLRAPLSALQRCCRLRRSWRCWTLAFARRRRLRILGNKVLIAACYHRDERRAFNSWTVFTALARVTNRTAALQRRNSSRRHLRAWCRLRRALAHRRHGEGRRLQRTKDVVFNQWRSWQLDRVTRRLQLEHLCMYWTSLCVYNLHTTAFTSWRAWRCYRRSVADSRQRLECAFVARRFVAWRTLLACVCHRRLRLQCHYFTRLRVFRQRRLALQQRVTLRRRLTQTRVLSVWLQRTRMVVVQRRRLGIFLEIGRKRLRLCVLCEWQRLARSVEVSRAIATRRRQRVLHRTLLLVWRPQRVLAYRSRIDVAHFLCRLPERDVPDHAFAADVVDRSVVSVAFAHSDKTWKRWTRAAGASSCIQRWRFHREMGAMRHWRMIASTQARQRRLVERGAALVRHIHMQQAVAVWRDFVERRRRQHTAVELYALSVRGRFYTRWLDAFSQRRLANVRDAKAELFRVQSASRLHLRVWHRVWRRRRYVVAAAAVLDELVREHVLQRCMNVWRRLLHRLQVLFRAAQLRHLRCVFAHWHERFEERRLHTQSLKDAITTARLSCLRASFVRLRSWSHRRARKRLASREFLRFFELRRALLLFARWRECAIERSQFGARLAAFLLRHRVRRGFDAWRLALAACRRERREQRAELAVARNHRRVVLRRALQTWARLRRCAVLLHAAHSSVLLPRAFRTWRRHCVNERVACRHWRRVCVRRHLLAFQVETGRRRRLRRAARQCRIRELRQCCCRALHLWNARLHANRRLQRLAATLLQRRGGRVLALHPPLPILGLSSSVICDASSVVDPLLLQRSFLRFWSTRYAVEVQRRLCLREQQVSAAFVGWRTLTRRSRQQRVAVAIVSHRRQYWRRREVVALALQRWRTLARLMRVEARFASRKDLEARRLCLQLLQQWHTQLHRRRRLRRLVQLIDSTRAESLLQSSFIGWHRVQARRRCARIVLSVARTSRLRSCRRSWSAFLFDSRAAQMERAVARGVVQRCWASWTGAWRARTHHLHATSLIVQRHRMHCSRYYLLVWCSTALLQRRAASLRAGAQLRLSSRCLRSWRSWASARRRAASLSRQRSDASALLHLHVWWRLSLAAQSRRCTVVRRSLQQWRVFVEHQRCERRHLALVFGRWLARHQSYVAGLHSLQRLGGRVRVCATWRVWRQTASQRRRWRGAVESLRARRRLASLHSCIVTLRTRCLHRSRARQARSVIEARLRHRQLGVWLYRLWHSHLVLAIARRFNTACTMPVFTHSFTHWREAACRAKSLRIVCTQISVSRSRRAALQTLQRWRAAMLAKESCRTAWQKAMTFAAIKQQGFFFHHWTAYCNARKNCRQRFDGIIRDVQRRRVGHRFRAWNMAARCQARYCGKLAHSCLRQWYSAWHTRRCVAFKYQCCRLSKLREVWAAWYKRLLHLLWLERQQHELFVIFERRRASFYLNAWATACSSALRSRSLWQAAEVFDTQRVQCRMFHALRRGASLSSLESASLERASVSWHVQYVQRRVLRILQTAAANQHAMRQSRLLSAEKLSMRLDVACKRRHLHAWSRSRHLKEVARILFTRHMLGVLRLHLRVWKKAGKLSARIRRRLMAAARYDRQRRLGMILCRWRSVVRMLDWHRSVSDSVPSRSSGHALSTRSQPTAAPLKLKQQIYSASRMLDVMARSLHSSPGTSRR